MSTKDLDTDSTDFRDFFSSLSVESVFVRVPIFSSFIQEHVYWILGIDGILPTACNMQYATWNLRLYLLPVFGVLPYNCVALKTHHTQSAGK